MRRFSGRSSNLWWLLVRRLHRFGVSIRSLTPDVVGSVFWFGSTWENPDRAKIKLHWIEEKSLWRKNLRERSQVVDDKIRVLDENVEEKKKIRKKESGSLTAVNDDYAIEYGCS